MISYNEDPYNTVMQHTVVQQVQGTRRVLFNYRQDHSAPGSDSATRAEFGETHVLNSITQGAAQKRFRLPGEVDIASQQFDIDYILSSRNYSATRTGTLTLNVNGQTKAVTLSDSFDYTGLVAYQDVIKFSALVQDADSDATQDSIDVLVASAMPGDDLSQLEFKIRNRKTIIDATGE